MSKNVKLTWKQDNEVNTEIVTQIDKNEAKFDPPIPIITDEGLGHSVNSREDLKGVVVFEDGDEIFALPKEQIVIIQDIEEAS
jgi:hypothetical protein